MIGVSNMFKAFLVLGLSLMSLNSFATDYYSSLKNMFDHANAAAELGIDFAPNAYLNCARSSSTYATDVEFETLGICSYISPAAGPAIPEQRYESICSEYSSSNEAFGFTKTGVSSVNGHSIGQTAEAVFVVDETGQTISTYKKMDDYLVFQTDGSYGYCWK